MSGDRDDWAELTGSARMEDVNHNDGQDGAEEAARAQMENMRRQKEQRERFFDTLYRMVALSEARAKLTDGERMDPSLDGLLSHVDRLETSGERTRATVMTWAAAVGRYLRFRELVREAEAIVWEDGDLRRIVGDAMGETTDVR